MELIVTPDNPAPPGGVCSNVRTSDRVVLRVARWHPEGQARGTIVLAQGRAEFIEKYFETIGELLARGFAVVTFDWRGQGLSARAVANPRKGHVDDFALFERDLEAVFSQAVQPFCPPPYFGLAHSTGASIMLQQARRNASPFARLVLLAPLIDIRDLRLPQGARLLADFLNVLGLGGAFIPGGGAKSIMSKPFKGNIFHRTLGDMRATRQSCRLPRNSRLAIPLSGGCTPHSGRSTISQTWIIQRAQCRRS